MVNFYNLDNHISVATISVVFFLRFCILIRHHHAFALPGLPPQSKSRIGFEGVSSGVD